MPPRRAGHRKPPPRRVRAGVALGASALGWTVASAAAVAFDRLLVAGGSWDGLLFFVAFMGLFTLGGWLAGVLPLALFVPHRGPLFHPVLAPVFGAACGALLLLLELAVFFGIPPWTYVLDGMMVGDAYALVLAAIVGACTWSAYVLLIRGWPWRTPG